MEKRGRKALINLDLFAVLNKGLQFSQKENNSKYDVRRTDSISLNNTTFKSLFRLKKHPQRCYYF